MTNDEWRMTNSESSRYAIVTGGASGLGREFCLRLARDGWHVAIVDVDAPGSEETRRLVEQAGGTGRLEMGDVTDPAAWSALRDRLQADWPRLDLLVNNAGMFASGRVGQLDLADAERVIRLNLLGVLYGCNAMVPWLCATARSAPPSSTRLRIAAKRLAAMRSASGAERDATANPNLPRPHVINVASSFAFITPPGMAVYSLTKAAVVALSETLYAELRPQGVGVTVVCPGAMPTRFIEHASFDSPAFRKLTEREAHQSTLDPAEVAAAALRAARRRKLYVVTCADQRWYWRLKRMFPTTFIHEVSRRVHRDLRSLESRDKSQEPE
jgi:NAD(P)-dependent dehydrogenase (short-subunit alcohol dehydrogenase family)